ncbi:MAG: sugar phosphate isomerase/epimerase [Clostridiales bacterium 38_11]|nr:MAG: sugar phosphate isomerase/epimerase [Clostridiales bacterium 38_11]
MKLGITVSTYPTNFGPIIFKDGNLRENIREMAALGYHGVDLFTNEKTPQELQDLRILFKDGGIEINTYLAIFLAEKGVKLSEINDVKRLHDIDLYRKEINNAQKIGAKSIALGYIRGEIGEGDSYLACEERLAHSLEIVGKHAAERGIVIGLEPINRYELNFINSVMEAVAFMKKFRPVGVGLLLDAFHMNIEDLDFSESIHAAAGIISNFHAPGSSRLATGSGHLDYDAIISALNETGYTGYLTLEAFPKPDSFTVAKQSAEFLKGKFFTHNIRIGDQEVVNEG